MCNFKQIFSDFISFLSHFGSFSCRAGSEEVRGELFTDLYDFIAFRLNSFPDVHLSCSEEVTLQTSLQLPCRVFKVFDFSIFLLFTDVELHPVYSERLHRTSESSPALISVGAHICLLASGALASLNADAGEPSIISDSSLSQEGVLIIRP